MYPAAAAATHSTLAAITAAISALRSAGVESAILTLGGNVQTLGVKPYAVQRNRQTAARLGRERVRTLYEQLYALSSKSYRMKKTLYHHVFIFYKAVMP